MNYLTQEGYDKLAKELDYLRNVRQQEIAAEIKVAMEFGDLSENAEYIEAKNEQARIHEKARQIEEQLKRVKIIESPTNSSPKEVLIGDTVKVLNKNLKVEMNLTILGKLEVDVKQNKISNESPIGKALMGGKEGDIVEVKTGTSTIKYEILEIIR